MLSWSYCKPSISDCWNDLAVTYWTRCPRAKDATPEIMRSVWEPDPTLQLFIGMSWVRRRLLIAWGSQKVMWSLFTLIGHEEEHVQHVKNKTYLSRLMPENSDLKKLGLGVALLNCNPDFFLLQVLKDKLCSFTEGQGLCLSYFLLHLKV